MGGCGEELDPKTSGPPLYTGSRLLGWTGSKWPPLLCPEHTSGRALEGQNGESRAQPAALCAPVMGGFGFFLQIPGSQSGGLAGLGN